MEEWKEYKLSELCNIFTGKKDVNQTTSDGCYPFFSCAPTPYRSSEFIFDGKAIIVAGNGSFTGRVSCFSGKFDLYQRTYACALIGEDVDFVYLYFYMKAYFEPKFMGGTRGSSIPYIVKGDLADFKVVLPSLDKQQQIASILKSLDDKIDADKRINDNLPYQIFSMLQTQILLLKRKNDNLEQQAKALFKSWFVDFEPFTDGEFVESELGLIPKGWRVGKLSELIEIKYGKDHKKLLNGDFPVYGSGGLMRFAETSLHTGESVLIPRKGTLNNVMYVNEAFWTVDTMFYSIPKINNIMLYVFLYLKNRDLSSLNAGSAVPSMTTEILNNMTVIIPPNNVLDEFNKIVFLLFSEIKQNQQGSHRLANIRDILLPQLMSGGLKISDLN
jgi:type I restriction enzyme S subunit